MMQGSRSHLPHSDACERNKDPILGVLQATLPEGSRVLELGSGTGQHVVYFAAKLPATTWQPSDTGDYLQGLRLRTEREAPENVAPPVEIDVRMQPWPVGAFDAVFAANVLHYMSKDCVTAFFRGVGEVLGEGGLLFVYGPFNYEGRYTSASNERFDQWLKNSDPVRAIRDFEWVNELAEAQSFRLLQDIAMPANNRTLVWGRTADV